MAPSIRITIAAQKARASHPEAATSNLPVSQAYVTFLAGDGDYVEGVVGLAKGLRKARSKHQLRCWSCPMCQQITTVSS